MNPVTKRAWLNAIRVLSQSGSYFAGAISDLATRFAVDVISPELKKHNAHFVGHEVEYPERPYLPRTTTGNFRESIRIGDDIAEIARAEYAPGRPMYYFLGAQVPSTYGTRAAGEARQAAIDAVPYRGFSFTYKGQRYDVTPGLVHVCLDLWPDTQDPDVLAYLEVITPIWRAINAIPPHIDPWS